MPLSRRKTLCSVSATERHLSCPAQGILVGTAQIIQTYIPDPKEFVGLTLRYKEAIAEFLQEGIWSTLGREEMMARFAVHKKPQYLNPIARATTKPAYVLEVTAFNDGDANHITARIKEHARISVQCTPRNAGEDEAGDLVHIPAVLIFHRSSKAAVQATMDRREKTAIEDIQRAAARVEALRDLEPLLLEVIWK